MAASIELQKAIFQKLSGGPYPVYDAVPTDSTMPYIQIGEEVLNDNSTKTDKRTKHLVTIHCWSNYQGTKQAKEMNDFVVDTLTQYDYNLVGYKVDMIQLELVQVIKDPDTSNLIHHGVVQIAFTLIKE